MAKIPLDDVLESLRVGIVYHGNSSEIFDAQLSKIEDNGEEMHGSETQIPKLRRQK